MVPFLYNPFLASVHIFLFPTKVASSILNPLSIKNKTKNACARKIWDMDLYISDDQNFLKYSLTGIVCNYLGTMFQKRHHEKILDKFELDGYETTKI